MKKKWVKAGLVGGAVLALIFLLYSLVLYLSHDFLWENYPGEEGILFYLPSEIGIYPLFAVASIAKLFGFKVMFSANSYYGVMLCSSTITFFIIGFIIGSICGIVRKNRT